MVLVVCRVVLWCPLFWFCGVTLCVVFCVCLIFVVYVHVRGVIVCVCLDVLGCVCCIVLRLLITALCPSTALRPSRTVATSKADQDQHNHQCFRAWTDNDLQPSGSAATWVTSPVQHSGFFVQKHKTARGSRRGLVGCVHINGSVQASGQHISKRRASSQRRDGCAREASTSTHASSCSPCNTSSSASRTKGCQGTHGQELQANFWAVGSGGYGLVLTVVTREAHKMERDEQAEWMKRKISCSESICQTQTQVEFNFFILHCDSIWLCSTQVRFCLTHFHTFASAHKLSCVRQNGTRYGKIKLRTPNRVQYEKIVLSLAK
jgi:hypothetical protein